MTIENHEENSVASGKCARRWLVTGLVQGVGFRPTVARIAASLGCAGSVENTPAGVRIELTGDTELLDQFPQRLLAELPLRAIVETMTVESIELTGGQVFEIRGEGVDPQENDAAPVSARVPPDVRICPQCLNEALSRDSRRGGYAFVSCVDCGPRYSIISHMPFERRDTSMRPFALCSECQREYEDPRDRRFHAQTNACRACGPSLQAIAVGELAVGDHPTNDPVEAARQTLLRGGIVALQGLGGWQLLVDATNERAVARLRDRKRRPAKPLAVLVPDLSAAETLAYLTPVMREKLSSPEGPIVLATGRGDSPLASNIHPGLDEVGLLLPTTPLHAQLTVGLGPLVATSGNEDGDPLEFDATPGTLSQVADVMVSHDREIVRPVDDSVIRFVADRPATVRLARGLAPLPLPLPLSLPRSDLSEPRYFGGLGEPGEGGGIIALGGHQKAAFALHNSSQAVLGPYIGDLDHETTRQRYLDQLRGFVDLYGIRTRVIVHDAHPDYFTTRLASDWRSWLSEKQIAKDGEIRLVAVQHHHAHVVASMVEHRLLDQRVLGFAWDGTGWGPEGTIWGGELLVVDRRRWHRVARLRPFALVGGELAVRQPWRVALAVAAEALGDMEAALRLLGEIEHSLGEQGLRVASLLASNTACMPTSSMGRLFDAVATLILPREWTQGGNAAFEGQLAMRLESACADYSRKARKSRKSVNEAIAQGAQWMDMKLAGDGLAGAGLGDGLREWDWRPLVRGLIEHRRRGVEPGELATLFHEVLTYAVEQAAGEYSQLPIVLGGGVFQNKALVERIAARFQLHGRWVGLPGIIPPNDGGLAAGQLAIASDVDLASD
ncbi:MAG: carbamoyltransferase HypF [Pirellulales bacterium]